VRSEQAQGTPFARGDSHKYWGAEMQLIIDLYRLAPRTRCGNLGRALLAAILVVFCGRPLSAQFVVHDAATTARNRTTAVLNELLYQLERQQQEKIHGMARRLGAITSLRRYSLSDVPRWRTHGAADVLFAREYLDALTFGDPQGAAYLRLAAALEHSTQLGRLTPAAQRAMVSRLASVDLADATAITGVHTSGRLRLSGRQNELEAINALERDAVDPSLEQSATAVLDKISGASLIGARQRQARIQLLTGVLEQLLVESKRLRDADAAVLNMQLVTWRDRRRADLAFVAGSSHALSTWRQP
jgi:hypothetical protein